jgi:hypothetical protein
MTKDAIAEITTLESQKISQALNDMLRSQKLDYDDLREIVANITTIESKKEAMAFLEVIDGYEDDGTYLWESYEFMRKFKRFVISQKINMREKEPNLSGIGLSQFSIQAKRWADWFFTDNLCILGMKAGRSGIIWGIPDSGKTDFCVHKIILPALKKGLKVISNIKINDCKYKNYLSSSLMSNTLIATCENAIAGCEANGKPNLTIKVFDDPVIKRLKAQAIYKKNIELKQLTHIFRKFGGFEWLLPQRIQDTPSEIIEFMSHSIHKPSVERPDWVNINIVSKGATIRNLKLYGVKGLEQRRELGMECLEFKTHQISDMITDIPLIPTLNYMLELTEGKPFSEVEQYEAIINYIKRHKGKAVNLDDEQIADVLALIHKHIKDYKGKTMGCRKLGALVGWSRDKVYDKLKARKIYPLTN